MFDLRRASVLSILAITTAFACGGSGSTTSSTGGGGSLAIGRIVVPLVPTGGDASELFRMEPDGSEVVQLTRATGAGTPTDNNDFPVISPDGETIVFASGRDYAPEVNPMLRAIYAMDADGGNVRRLTTAPIEDCVEYPGDISPDGQWVVFTRACDESIDPVTHDFDKLFRIHLDGTGEEKLAPNDELVKGDSSQDVPVFTRDGDAVLFVSGDLAAEIYKLDLATQKITQITKNADANRSASARRPLVAPKGDVVYVQTFASNFSGGRMEAVKLDGSGSTVLFEFPRDPGSTYDHFALSPEGDAFLFALSESSEEQALVITGLDGKNPKKIYPSVSFIGWGDPSWR